MTDLRFTVDASDLGKLRAALSQSQAALLDLTTKAAQTGQTVSAAGRGANASFLTFHKQGLSTLRTGLASFALSTLPPVQSGLARVAQSALLFVGGGPLVIGVAAGIGALALAFNQLGKETKKTRERMDELHRASGQIIDEGPAADLAREYKRLGDLMARAENLRGRIRQVEQVDTDAAREHERGLRARLTQIEQEIADLEGDLKNTAASQASQDAKDDKPEKTVVIAPAPVLPPDFAQRAGELAKNAADQLALAFDIAVKRLQRENPAAFGLPALKPPVKPDFSVETQFRRLVTEAEAAMAALDARRAEVQADVLAGVISEEEGQRRILAIEQDRLPALQQMASLMLTFAAAMKDPALLAQAQAFADLVGQISEGLDRAKEAAGEFGREAARSVQQDLTTFLADTVEQVDSVGEAFRELARSVINSIQQIVAAMIAAQIVQGIGSLLGGGGGGKTGNIVKANRGGQIPGGYGSRDTVPALLTRGEVVFSVPAVRTAGARELLELHELLRRGVNPLRDVQGFNAGGLVTPSPARPAAPLPFAGAPARATVEGGVLVEVAAAPGSVIAALRTTEGRRALREWAQDDRRFFRATVGG